VYIVIEKKKKIKYPVFYNHSIIFIYYTIEIDVQKKDNRVIKNDLCDNFTFNAEVLFKIIWLIY
jgi:hypothetical protein